MIRPAVRALLFLLLIARAAGADWITGGVSGPPHGIFAAGDRVLVFADDFVHELGPNGAPRASRRFTVKDGSVYLERVLPLRDGFLATAAVATAFLGPNGPVATTRSGIVRFDANGNVQWTRAVDVDSQTDKSYAAVTPDGDIVVATRAQEAVFLRRFSGTGELRWTRRLDRTDVEQLNGLVAAKDGGALLLTTALSRGAVLTRITPAGETQWDRVLGTADAGWGLYDAVELADGGFLCAGRTRSYSTSNRQGWLVRVSAKGDPVWQKTLGGAGEEGLYALTRAGDDAYAALGGTSSTAGGDADTWIVRFNAAGEIKSELAIGTAAADGPVDTYRGLITASGGDLLFVVESAAGGFAGRVSGAPSCNARAVRSPVEPSRANPSDMRLENERADTRIETLAFNVGPATSAVQRICSGTASTTAKPQPQTIAAEERSEEDRFAEEVARMLLDGKHQQLDSLANDLRTKRARFDSGASKLRAFYEAVARHSTLDVGGNEAHARLLDAWQRATHSATSTTARAAYELALAERVRGVGYFHTLLPEDAKKYEGLIAGVLSSLAELDRAGSCDAACYDLQLRAATAGGWTEPLRKLLKTDPAYWEGIAPAAWFLREEWGGKPGDVDRFVPTAAEATKAALGDSVYALHYAAWKVGSPDATVTPDWARMRKGFEDFLKLHPKSARVAHQFALAAYNVTRDRETARKLFASPLLAWRNGLAVWPNRGEYDRVKAWALDSSTSANAPAKRSFATLTATLPGGSTIKTYALVVMTPKGPVGVASLSQFIPPNQSPSWTLDLGKPVRLDHVTFTAEAASFVPPPEVLAAMQTLTIREQPLTAGDRLFITGPTVIAARASASSPTHSFTPEQTADWIALAGVPVLDDSGRVVGVFMPSPRRDAANQNLLPIQLFLPRQ